MKTKFTQLRKLYKTRYIFRLLVLAFVIVMYFAYPQSFSLLNGLNFFHEFSWLHLLWLGWVISMVSQLIPAKGYLPLGSVKQFKEFYQPMKKLLDRKELIAFVKKGGLDSLKVILIWITLITGIGILWTVKWITHKELFLISVVFYVLDLTFVLFWCPFRVLILKNRCCTTCRIFNWDHMMMFSPLLFTLGFYAISLFALAIAVFLVWEICFFLHPERFFEETNAALKCHNCTDNLCGNKNCRL